MVLTLSDKPADRKLESFFKLYEACKAAKHATSRDKAMVIYAAFADSDLDPDEITAAVSEVDDWLRGQKGYGAFSLGTSERRLFAVGDCYYLGAGVEKDLEAAAEWYQKALDAGYEPDEEDQKHLAEVMGSK